MKKLLSIGVLTLVIAMGVFMVGCKDEYNFADNVISVALTEQASLVANTSGKLYDANDFPELELAHVENLGIQLGQIRILHLYLLEPSHKRVLDYIKILKKRSDVQNAVPSYPGSGD